ncbi:MAG TPA: tetratricopeptide repeat protein [Anaerolineaceae bacterium]|nr:tetratricopeptide repeat protein [Anaerolineaceae bacterium]
MAKIPLRIYNREIENLIDRGQTEEAIAHCKHLLQTYPKHIDTYRLMGKSFLESQRYGEAADIFQRVLSSVPDDFVSHVGMSIVREDEGNLDAAIWHMERAFEVQPANSAVQDELRRLYGRRDGLEPPKVRLTRGALVRMYARGDLYQQAIAEIRAALAEDPQRNDLQILLARMYYLAGQKVEATEVCSNILAKFPYCYEANRILAEILPGTSRADDAPIYQQRVAALDPYVSFTSASTPDPADVSDAAVSLERMIWDPARVSSQPQWAESLGIQIEHADEGPIPDWLSTVSGQVGAKQEPSTLETGEPAAVDVQPFAEDTLSSPVQAFDALAPENEEAVIPVESEENLIPDWMKEAGWIPSEGKEEEPPAIDFGAGEPADEISTGEMPEWLKAMAPAGLGESEATSLPLEPEETKTAELPVEPPAEEAVPAEIPDWLNNVIAAPEAPVASTAEQISSAETLPAEPGEAPDWLSELKSASPEPTPMETGQPSVTAETKIPLGPAAEAPQISQPLQGQDDALAWLESLAASHGAEEGTLFVPPEQRQETPPEWVQKAAETGEVAAAEPSVEGKPDEPTTQQEIRPSADTTPGWLEEFAGLPPQPAEEEESPAAVPGEIPDWLSSLASASETAEAASKPTPAQVTPPSPSFPSMEDQDAALAWLEGLAARQGAGEEAMFTPPEERTETPPQWVQEAANHAEEVVSPVEPPAAEPAAEQPFAVLAEEELLAPDAAGEEAGLEAAAVAGQPAAQQLNPEDALAWLESLAAKHGADEETLFVPPDQRQETPPSWVSEFTETEASISGPILETQGPSQEIISAAEDYQIEPEIQTNEAAPQESQIPDWLQDLKKEEISQQPAETPQPDNLPTWLQEGIAQPEAETGPASPAAEISSPSPQEATPADLPDWLHNLQSVQPPTAPTVNQEAPQPDSPEWLQDGVSAPVEQPEMADTVVDWTHPEPAAPPEPVESKAEAPSEPVSSETLSDTRPDQIGAAQAAAPDQQELFSAAHQNIAAGKIPEALNGYAQLIESGALLNETILDLREALYRYPVDVTIWEKLGDAYARDNRLQDALDAYTKAEELLR